jgi:hypothetical protein
LVGDLPGWEQIALPSLDDIDIRIHDDHLKLSPANDSFLLEIINDFILFDGTDWHEIVQDDRRQLISAITTLGRSIRLIGTADPGILILQMANGSALRVEPNATFEAWLLYVHHSRTPGGIDLYVCPVGGWD